MTLNQIAQQAMDYLDSVGVAADYEIDSAGKYGITIITDDWSFQFLRYVSVERIIKFIKTKQKSPA